ncbi:MAG: amidohydrolase [Candidatus Zixiibacteriota bacterium]
MKGFILLNGKIYTLNKNQSQAQALAISGSKILSVGKNEEIRSLRNKKFEIIDLKGKTVLPGFVDCHTHFLYFASTLDTLDIRTVKTLDSLKSRIKDKLKNLIKGKLLFIKGWDKNIFKDQSIFNKKTLDRISNENPVAIFSKDQHTFWVNSQALKLARVNQRMNSFPEKQIEKDPKTRELSGIIRENACDLILELIKKSDRKKARRRFKGAVKIAHQNGLVGIHEMGFEDALHHYQNLLMENKLNLRVYTTIPQSQLDLAANLGLKTGFGNQYLKFGGVKLYVDGSLGSQSALTFKPYIGSKENFGIEALTQKELTSLVRKANSRGINATIHAIGDRAVHQALNALERAGNKSLRNRIEHIQLIQPQDLKRFARLNTMASVQPVHATSDREIAEKYWGKRCKLAYPYNSLLKNKARVVFGSDMPIENLSPLMGIYAAVTRKRKKDKKGSWHPEQRISVSEAVYAYTLGAAYASFEDKLKGSIQAGKLADLVILSGDIFRIPPDEIPQVQVLATIFDGKIVHGKEYLSNS